MITKMKKYTFLIFHKEYEDFLLKVRDLGVVHVETKQEGQAMDKGLQNAVKQHTTILSVERFLQTYIDKKHGGAQKTATLVRGMELIKEVEELRKTSEALTLKLQSIQKEADIMSPWGDFEISSLQKLKDAGYKLNFYIASSRDFKQEWVSELNAVVIRNTGSHCYFVILSKMGEHPTIEVEQAKLGQYSLLELEKQAEETTLHLEETKKQIVELANTEMESLELAKREVQNEIEFSNVVLGGDRYADDKLVMLQGWIPEEKETVLKNFLDTDQHFYEEEKVALTDNVPILLKNNAFAKLYEPITRMFNLPNYSELDPTAFFAPFFMLFFGLCMGDGGYGLIIMAICLWAKTKVSESAKGFCQLGVYFGLSTVIVGILTGSFFGIALDSVEWAWLKGVKGYFITDNNYAEKLGGYSPLMIFAIVIGLVQILFGMCINAAKIIKQFGVKYALFKIGWVVFLVSVGIAFGLPAFGVELPMFVLYAFYGLIGVSVLLILFYNSPDKNVLSNFASGLWDTYNMATGLLGDTLSYIRLFALGLTGAILGGVFNSLAFELTATLPAVARFFAAFLILILGHGINFALCLISSLVHPIRLTFVEFYKNSGFEGGGTAYKPFKK
ncbi:ATPase [Bacteroides sp. 214]|uniref:V-type ATP synthase subunit I n=1 Tax=Bacteroides sp. 214 TaxID=2302935 RepID=UPI0013D00305|nr:V-type ATPase 116kDa subunit family protein [Bacteroides sp. 214]NDW12652.1 ATPase [Bacteroides sp. 214]